MSYSDRKSSLGYVWIKSDSGNSYLCPAGSFDRNASKSDDELSRHCVEESSNPQND